MQVTNPGGIDSAAVQEEIQSRLATLSIKELVDVSDTVAVNGEALVMDGETELWTPQEVSAAPTAFSVGESSVGGSTATTSFDVPLPDHDIGDMILLTMLRDDSGTISAPVGWITKLSSSTSRHHVFAKPVESVDDVETFTSSNSTTKTWIAQVYRGVNLDAVVLENVAATTTAIPDTSPYNLVNFISSQYTSVFPSTTELLLTAQAAAAAYRQAAYRSTPAMASIPAKTFTGGVRTTVIGITAD